MNNYSLNNFVRYSLLFIILLFTFYFIKYIFKFQFGGYDLSPLIDLCSRLNRGDVPGKDFISTFPLSFLLWLKINLLFFNNNYNFLLYSGYSHFIICTIFVGALLRQNLKLNTLASLTIIIAVMAVPELVTNHIWHSIISQYNCIVVLIVIINIIIAKKITVLGYIVFALFVGFALFSKQNVGILCVGLCAVTLIICYLFKVITLREVIASALIFICSTVFYVLLIHSLLRIDYSEFIRTYTSVLGRGIPSIGQIKEVFIISRANMVLTLFSIVFSLILFRIVLQIKKKPIDTKIFIGFIFSIQVIGYYAFLTDWDIKFNDFPLIGLSTIILLSVIFENNVALIRSYHFAIILIVALAVYLGVKRYRMNLVGYGAFYEDGQLYKINDGYLKGLYVGKKLYAINKEIDSLKKGGIIPVKTFFGPRMEFGYTQYNIPSPAHMPLWWHPGSSYNIRDEKKVISIFTNFNFDVLIFLKGDRTRMPQAIIDYISENYYIYKPSVYLDIYKHNQE